MARSIYRNGYWRSRPVHSRRVTLSYINSYDGYGYYGCTLYGDPPTNSDGIEVGPPPELYFQCDGGSEIFATESYENGVYKADGFQYYDDGLIFDPGYQNRYWDRDTYHYSSDDPAGSWHERDTWCGMHDRYTNIRKPNLLGGPGFRYFGSSPPLTMTTESDSYNNAAWNEDGLPQELAKQKHGPQPVPDEAAGKVGAEAEKPGFFAKVWNGTKNVAKTTGKFISRNLDRIQTGLDYAGFVPFAGAIPDGVNTAISAVRGNWVDAGVNFVAIFPGPGDALKGTKMAKEAIEQGVKHADEVKDAFTNTRQAIIDHVIQEGRHFPKKSPKQLEDLFDSTIKKGIESLFNRFCSRDNICAFSSRFVPPFDLGNM